MPQLRPDLTGPIAEDTPHFNWIEARCRHCGRLPGSENDDLLAVINAARMMEKVRALLGHGVLHVNSFYRCEVHNRAIGGASDSQHVHGRAVDFTARHLSPSKVQAILRQHWGEGKTIRGLGVYNSFTHVDNRPTRPAKWRG